MKLRTDYKNTPKHLQLDENKAKCPCGKKAVAFWIETTTGMHLGFECEDKHLFQIDMEHAKKTEEIKTIYVSKSS